ncbi:hypothetical protein Ancab_039136 [Ancistrocladus abbreviatus]
MSSMMVRRLVCLPRSILGGFSRAIGIGGRRHQMPPPLPPSLPAPLLSAQNDEWAFLTDFEDRYGSMHPLFYVCRFVEALKIAQDEHKFMFMYLHSPDHPFTASFCRDTLCSELVVQFLDANFVSWGGLADRGEALHMAATLRPASFPFCAVIAPASGDNIAVLQQIEGPVSPAELVEILQRTLEEQGVAFGSSRAKEEEKRRADRRLREEQDAAYLAALKIDQERETVKNFSSEQTTQKPQATPTSSRMNPAMIKPSKVREATPTGEPQQKDDASKGKDPRGMTQILIRFPNGERREQSFSAMDKIQSIYKYIDSLGLPGIGNYRLISSFPRKVYGVDQMNMTLKDADLHPRASLFMELL